MKRKYSNYIGILFDVIRGVELYGTVFDDGFVYYPK